MRSNTLDAARRGYLGIVRGTIEKVDDSQKMQTVDARLLHNEMLTGIERPQNYGFSSVPVGPQGTQAAELMVGFLHGNRSHPMVLGVDDRRTRPTGWKEGESGLWHYKGATAKFTDDGFVHDQGSDKKPLVVMVGNLTVTWADGKAMIDVGGTQVIVQAGRVDLGGPGGSRVLTEAGPSSKVYAIT